MSALHVTLIDSIQALFELEIEPELTRPEPQFGDYTTNVALQLAGRLKQPPRQIAEQLAAALSETGVYENVEVAGPGFINLWLKGETLLELTARDPLPARAGQSVVIETNNPNPFKAMHIGHAYNAIIADTIANLLAISGAQTHRVSYHGDVGAHVGKSMWSLLRFCDGDPSKLNEIAPQERNAFMNKMYAEGAKAASEDEAAKQEIEQLSKQSFTQEDAVYRQIYTTVKDWSFAEIDSTVRRLGNVPIERRYLESQSDPIGVKTVLAQTPNVFQESNGAFIFEGSKYGSFDNAFVASNGQGLYAARDLGLLQLKQQDYPQMDACIVVTANEQAAYFKGVIAAAEQAIPETKGKLQNISTGSVKLASGKMSSRTGDVVTVDWLFDAFAKAVEERGGTPTDEVIAGALRYQFLKVKIGNDVVFDVNEAVSLTGNTGSYLQYAHARASSMLQKASAPAQRLTEVREEDRLLVRKLGEYHEIMQLAMRTLEPHHLCIYLFELTQTFNRYYEAQQVIGSEHEAHRVALVRTYADTLKAGLMALGMHAPSSM